MSKRAEQRALTYAKTHSHLGYDYDQTFDAVKYGYLQAEKDLALTPADIKQIVEIYDECLNLTFEEGKPAYESDGFYEEVLRRFIEQKGKK